MAATEPGSTPRARPCFPKRSNAHTAAAVQAGRGVRRPFGGGSPTPGSNRAGAALRRRETAPRGRPRQRAPGIDFLAPAEALAVLRNDGLIITRPGKNGGSFVRRPKEPLPLANDELTRLSSAELRDLGDWRQMLTWTAAGLAAQRAAQSNIERLELYAEQVAAAEDNEEARRAYARYHVELAAATQSARLSRAEFSMHEEFDWLAGLILSDPLRRRDSARALHAVTAAVRDQQPRAAEAAAQEHVTAVFKELVRLRLELIAAPHRPLACPRPRLSSKPSLPRSAASPGTSSISCTFSRKTPQNPSPRAQAQPRSSNTSRGHSSHGSVTSTR